MNKMENSGFDAGSFWDQKILKWERGRYGAKGSRKSALEYLADRASRSLQYRMELARSVLQANCNDKTVVEIGCGSARLAGDLIRAGAKHYQGYDISEVAIDAANNRIKTEGLGRQVEFSVADIAALPHLNADIVFSLGLLDWLTDDDVRLLFCKSVKSECLHSFSESRLAVSQLIHRSYVYIAYGHKTKAYVPRYMKASWLGSIAKEFGARQVHFVRDRRLSFGAFMTSLPVLKTL